MTLRGEQCWETKPAGDGGLCLQAYCGEELLAGTVEIPAEIDGTAVTALAKQLFYEYKGIERVLLPDSIRKIGAAAFCICNRLREIRFPAGWAEIPEDCFNECGFETLTLPDSVRRIRRGAYINNRQLRRAVLPPKLEALELMTFSGCSALEEVVLPEGLVRIEDAAFSSCKTLASIILPEGLEEIGAMAFLGCRSLREVVLPGSVRKIGDMAFPPEVTLIREGE